MKLNFILPLVEIIPFEIIPILGLLIFGHGYIIFEMYNLDSRPYKTIHVNPISAINFHIKSGKIKSKKILMHLKISKWLMYLFIVFFVMTVIMS